jgi:hypothetical protein
MSTEPVIKFSNEDSKARSRTSITKNIHNLVELSKSVTKSSESSDLFANCIKNFAAAGQTVELAHEKYKKIEIISTQLNYQLEAIKSDCESLQEICKQIDSIQKKSKRHKQQN